MKVPRLRHPGGGVLERPGLNAGGRRARGPGYAPCGVVSNALETSKTRKLFSSCPCCSVRWARNTGADAVEPGMAPSCQSAANPLRARTAVNLRMRGVVSIRMSCWPNAMGLYGSRFPVAMPLGIGHMMAPCQDSRTSAPAG